MARSMYWPHPIYLDIFIVFTYLITSCNASNNSGEMTGIIAGSILAFILLVAGIIGIVYCVIRSQRSKEAKKQQKIQASNNVDYRTVVVRRVPAASVRYPTIVGYPDMMVEYHASVHGHLRPKVPMASHMSTLSHMPVQRPALVPMGYYTARPKRAHQSTRGKYIEDRKSKTKSQSRSRATMSNSISNHRVSDIEVHSPKDTSSWGESRFQFILRKKEEPPKTRAESKSKPSEPYALTSLFSRNRELVQKPEPPPPRPETRYFLPTEKEMTKEDLETYGTIRYPPTYTKQASSTREKSISRPVSYPVKSNSPVRDFEVEVEVNGNPDNNPEDERPITPDYDDSSNSDEEGTNPDVSFTGGNKFSYALAAELKQNARFRLSSNGNEEPPADLFGTTSKSVQFNPLSYQDAYSTIETSSLNPGSYGNVPPAPPLPPT